jgi:hypothetical protein
MTIGFPTEMGTQPSSHVKAGHTAKKRGFTLLFQKEKLCWVRGIIILM